VEHGVLTETASLLHGPATAEESRRIREHLDRLLDDPLFNHSKRLPAFLNYVVKEALAGTHDGQIKERTVGVEVFGRPANYDTNSDPVVRITAGEVRKRLAQYYYANTHEEVQIEVPLGSYIPRFRFAGVAPVEASPVPQFVAPVELRPSSLVPPAPPVSSGFSFGWLALAIVMIAGVGGFFFWRHNDRANSVDKFWTSFTTPSKPVLLVLPAIARAAAPLPQYHYEAESVAIEDAEVARRISNEFRARNLDSHLVLATRVSLSDLRDSPFVLIGAMDNVWTMRLSQSLPFAFERSDDRRYGRIVDRKDPKTSWTEDFSVPNQQIVQDYGIVARFTDPTAEQPTVLIAGISAEGTLAAGEAVTTPKYLDMLLKASGGQGKNFEAVIDTRVIGGQSGPPQIVAMRTW
jgi:hypothetical protein